MNFSEELAATLENFEDDGAAAQSHLDAGRPIYYWDDRLQSNVRKWPDGRIEPIEFDEQGNIIVRA